MNNDFVFLSVLCRNKEEYLDKYLRCIDELDYDKKKIVVYINTNNNDDATESILCDWIQANSKKYNSVIYESHHIDELDNYERVGEWEEGDFVKCVSLGAIRNRSVNLAKIMGCRYYFVIDVDNWIIPETLKVLIEKKKPIVAPMLRNLPKSNTYANFFSHVNENGYFGGNDEPGSWYNKVWNRYEGYIGTYPVPLVHCTYLIDLHSENVDKLTYIDREYGLKNYEFATFSRSARNADVQQYICNELDFGFVNYECEIAAKEVDYEYLLKGLE